METFRRALLITIAALTLFSIILDVAYTRRSVMRRMGHWYDRGKKAVGFS
ncbi:MAG TPA: hypothetical protein VIK48_06170 [Candidatus Manganitrophaceae bacterium]